MKQRYELYGNGGYYFGEITHNQVTKGLEWNILKPVELGNSYECRCISLEHFNQEFKKYKMEEKNKKIQCWACGELIKSTVKHKRVYCDKCNENRIEQEKNDILNYTILRKKIMLERAIKILENQEKKINIDDYKDAIEAIEEYIKENVYKFDSAHEMVAAIELIKSEVKITIQPSIEGMIFDFMIKQDKIVLEIDGYMHKSSIEKDGIRDLKTREVLGEDWEVIRIPTNYIEKNISALYRAITELNKYKKDIRKGNNNVLPDYYSEREKSIWIIN